MGELFILVGVLAPGIAQIITALKNIELLKELSASIWLAISVAIGAGVTIWLDVDVSSLPVRGPELVTQGIVGLLAAAGSRLTYEGVEVVRAKRAQVRAIARRGG